MCEEDRENMKLNTVWRACRKIQEAIFRYGLNICEDFCIFDPQQRGLVSASIFINVLGRYQNIIGLAEVTVRELTDYFKLRDGRVSYKQFCKAVCHEKHTRCERDLATCLEWNDPMHVNVLPKPEERRRLCKLLIQIAQTSNLPLRPYFQDYEMISKNCGTVTIAHFSRVLHFLKIRLSDDDFLLLLKRYLKDSYTVNYVAFMKHIENIISYYKERRLTDNANHVVQNFPGKLIDLDLPELPAVSGINLAEKIFSDQCNNPRPTKNVCDVVNCIQKFIHERSIRVREFLEGFDHLKTGTITKNQFERALFSMGVHQLLTQKDIAQLCQRYIDPIDTDRIMWRNFEDEIDSVFTIKRLDKRPLVQFESPPAHIAEMPRKGAVDWDAVEEPVRNYCTEALTKVQTRIKLRRLFLHPFFRNYDKHNSGRVRCQQANQVFRTNGILLSEKELKSLLLRYGDETGFNYTRFLDDADPADYGVPQLCEASEARIKECMQEMRPKSGIVADDALVKMLSGIKSQATQRSVPVLEFLIDYDRHREGEILELDFIRGLDNAGIKVKESDLQILCETFRSPKRACCVLYRDFCNALDQIFVHLETSAGDNEFQTVPLLHLANLDCDECFLNFDERTVCSNALMKLARKPDEISNLRSIFKDFDREKCGSVRQNQFMRALTVRDMHFMISKREFDAICKCFGVSRGLHMEFNYREFLNTLDVLYFTGQVHRNY